MTSKFSIDNRELLQRISSGEAVVGIDFGNLIVRELAAFRLAAMDSEPVAWMHNNNNIGIPAITTSQKIGQYWMSEFKDVQPLYRHAQPAPVVPEECQSELISFCEQVIDSRIAACAKADELWNACRAAILAAATQLPGSDPATVPGKWISVSERMPEKNQNVLISVNFDSDLVEPLICSARYTGSTFRRGDATVKPGAGIEEATHWMPLPAGPQEVKS